MTGGRVQIDSDRPIRVFVARTQWTPEDHLAFVGHLPLFLQATPDTSVLTLDPNYP